MKKYDVNDMLSIIFTNRKDGSFTKETFPDYVRKQTRIHHVSYAVLTHGLDIAFVDKNTKEIYQHADTIMTNEKDLVLSMTVGDCVPVVLFDKKTGAVALIHCGWKNLMKGVVTKSFQSFFTTYHAHAEDMFVWIGPSIQKCCNVWKDTLVYKDDSSWNLFIEKKDDGYHVDMQGYIENVLLNQGIKRENIVKEVDCTYHERETYFSHRRSTIEHRQEDDGRMGIAVWKI